MQLRALNQKRGSLVSIRKEWKKRAHCETINEPVLHGEQKETEALMINIVPLLFFKIQSSKRFFK